MKYWYENKHLLKKEREGYEKFMRGKFPDTKIRQRIDNENRLVFLVEFSFRISTEALKILVKKSKLSNEAKEEAYRKIDVYGTPPKRHFSFMMRYEHMLSDSDSSGDFGGEIRAYVMTKIDKTFHHLITDYKNGLKYVCQASRIRDEDANSKKLMEHMLRFCEMYVLWEITGVDIDRLGGFA